MSKQHPVQNFLLLGLLFVAFVFIGSLAFFTLSLALTGSSISNYVPYIFPPNDSGLSDHIEYGMKMGAIIGLLAYAAYLSVSYRKKFNAQILAWLAAGVLELILLFTSLVDKSISEAPYVFSNYASSWLQILVAIPLIVGLGHILRMDSGSSPLKKNRSSS